MLNIVNIIDLAFDILMICLIAVPVVYYGQIIICLKYKQKIIRLIPLCIVLLVYIAMVLLFIISPSSIATVIVVTCSNTVAMIVDLLSMLAYSLHNRYTKK